jgi:hypothetical protein
MTTGDVRCDFFVSYTDSDVSWAEWIAWQLEKGIRFGNRPARVFVQVWDAVPGTHWPSRIQRVLPASGRVVPVLSPEYLADSGYGNAEWLAIWPDDPDGRQRRIVPVRVAKCEPRGLLRTVTSIDLVGRDQEATARAALLEGIHASISGRARPRSAPPFPLDGGAKPPAFPGSVRWWHRIIPALRGIRSWAASVLRAFAGSVVAGIAAALRRIHIPRVPALTALAGIVVVGIVAGIVILLFGGRTDDRCGIPTQLVLSTSADTAVLMRDLVQEFTESDRSDGCRQANIQVVRPSAAGGTTKALADGWPSEDLRAVGPYPHVWMPSSSVEVDRVEAGLRAHHSAIKLSRLTSVMSSYLVLAVPDRLAQRSGWSDHFALSLDDVLQRAESSKLRIVREGPEASTEGFVSTVALYRAAVGGRLDAGTLRNGGTRFRLHRVEQATVTSGGIEDPGRGLGCRAATSAGPDFKVALMSEQRVFAHNQNPRASCGVPADRLTAFYPADGVPLLDYPFVIVDGQRRGDPARVDVAKRFHSFLERAQARLEKVGFRPPGGAAFNRLPPNLGVEGGPPRSTYEVNREPVVPDAVVEAWRFVRRRARVLFAVDVSGSMVIPGVEGVTPLDAAKQAIEPALGLVSGDDQIGLWKFATKLDGPRDYVEMVGLGPAAISSVSRRDEVRRALTELHGENSDTGLFDTIQAGIAALRADGATTTADALMVFTDAINDDRDGIKPDSLVEELNQPGVPQARVMLLAFGEANCGRLDLEPLLSGGVKCENVTSAAVKEAVERVGAGLWGVH